MYGFDLFPIIFITLWVGHTFADHWVQTDHQAKTKGQRDYEGRKSCAVHVYMLTLTQVTLLAGPVYLLDIPSIGWVPLFAGLIFNAGTHYWIDRRFTLAALCDRLGKGGFYRMGTGLGTGAYALDQSAHMLMLFISALIISV